MADLASLGIKVTTSGATQAKSELDSLAASGQKAQQSTDKLSQSVNAQKAAFDKLADEIDPIGAKLNKLADYQTKLDKALKDGVVGQESYAKLSALLDKQSASALRASDSMAKLSLNSTFAQREIGRIVSDAITGNYSRLEMSSLTLANATGLMGMAFSAAGVAVLGAVAAIGLVAAGAITSQLELNKLNTTVIATGQAAGLTGGALYDMAATLAAQGNNLNDARTAVEKLAGSGMSGAGLSGLAQAALNTAKVTGESIDQIVQSFENIQAGPSKAIAKLNDQYNFLTSAQYAEIAALEEQGKTQDAARVAMSDYTTAMNERAKEVQDNAGWIIQAAHGVRDAWNDAWKAVSNIGSSDLSVQEKQLQAKIDELKNPTGLEGAMADSSQLAKLQQQLKAVQLLEIQQGFAATQKAADDLANRQSIQAQQELAQYKTPKQQLDDTLASAAEQRAKALYGVTDSATIAKIQGEFNQEVQQAQETYKNALKKLNGPDASGAQFQDMLQQYKNVISAAGDAFKNYEDRLTQMYKSGKLSAADYYTSMQAAVTKSAAVQNAEIQAEIDAIQKRGATGKQAAQDQQRISELQAQMAKNTADANAKAADYADQFAADQKKQALAAAAFTEALQNQIDVQRMRVKAQIDQVTMGDKEYQQEQELIQIEQKRADALQKLQDQQSRGDFTLHPEQYQKQVDEVNAAYDAMKSDQISGYKQLDAAQSDWSNGAITAIQNYADTAQNVAKLIQSSFTDAFDQMGDDLLKFETTGKLSFKSFASAILDDILKIENAKLIAGIATSFSSLFSNDVSGGSVGTTASSGISSWINDTSNNISWNARGNAFENSPDLSAYSGSVVSKPTFFRAFATGGNVMGEAGPEAILPLKRGSDGNLGVSSGSQPVQLSINLKNESGQQLQATQSSSPQINGNKIMAEFVINTIATDMSRNGTTAQALQSAFGLRKAGVRVGSI